MFGNQAAFRRATRELAGGMTAGIMRHPTASIHCIDAGGDGTPVLFLHSNSAMKEAFHLQFASLKKAGYRPLAFDFPGHGQSSDAKKDPASTYTITHYADLAKELVDQLALESPILVGWSLGGHVAIEYAGRGWPYRGVLITGTPPAGPGTDGIDRAFLSSEFGDVAGMRAPSKEKLDQYVDGLYGSLDPIPSVYRSAAFRTDGLAREAMFMHWVSHVDGCHQPTVIRGMDKPLCIVHGRDDPFISLEYLQSLRYSETLFQDGVIVFDHVGHSSFLEAPAAFDQVLLAFCEECDSRSA